MKKKTIALVAAVALVVLAIPTVAFANVMHNNPFGSSNSTAPAIRVLDAGQNAQRACPGYADTDNNGMCDNYDQGACPGYHDQDGNGICDNYGQGVCPNGAYDTSDDNTGVGQGYGQGRHHGNGHGNGHRGNGGAGYGCMRG